MSGSNTTNNYVDKRIRTRGGIVFGEKKNYLKILIDQILQFKKTISYIFNILKIEIKKTINRS